MKYKKAPLALCVLILLIGFVIFLMMGGFTSQQDPPEPNHTSQQDQSAEPSGSIVDSGLSKDDIPAPSSPDQVTKLLLPSEVVDRAFPKVDLGVLATRLPNEKSAVFERMRLEFPEVDWTEIEQIHQAFFNKRSQLPLNLNDQQREAHAAWLAEVEPVSRALIELRAKEHGLSSGGMEGDRGYYLDGFRNGEPVYIVTTNVGAAITTGVNQVRWNPGNPAFDPALGSNTVNGSEFYVTICDGGELREHTEFQLPNAGGSRIVTKEAGAFSDHMTHVAGTMAAWGYNASAQGMAPRSWIRALIQQSPSDYTTYGMATPGQQMAEVNPITGNPQLRSVVGNTSLGTANPNTGYDSASANYDTILRDYPYYMHFNSSGNSGDLGFESITGTWKVAKNMMAIGNISAATRDANGLFTGGAAINATSSRGPSYDGRIKPDFVAKGTDVTSSTGTTTYSSYSGTSMASPNAAGSVALLMDYVRLRMPQQYLRSSTYRALLTATADDRGNPGPDYTFGWGILNVHAAAKIVREQANNSLLRLIVEDSLAPNQTWTENYASDGTKPIRVSVVWLDPASTNTDSASRASRLVNDLDVRLIGPGGVEYQPYVMPFVTGQGGTPAFDVSLYDASAVTGDNTTDPVELIHLAAPSAGSYTVSVTHKGTLLNNLAQPFSVAVSGMTNTPPTMEVSRAGSTIDANGVNAVSGTSAGNGTQLSYTITNVGDDALELTTPVTISNASNCSVTVATQPNATLAKDQGTNLVLTVTPAASGTWSFGISVASNDPFRNPYTWTVTGIAGYATGATFTPDADTYINAAASGANYGSDPVLSIWNRGAGNPGNYRYGLMHFNLSSVPAGATVTAARLEFVQDNTLTGSVEIYEATGSWTESQATWTNSNGLIGTTLFGTANAPGVAAGSVPSINLNASGLAKIQSWIDTPSGNHGFSVKTNSTANPGNIDLRSREHATPPRLILTYDGGAVTAPLMVVTDANGYLPAGGTRSLAGTVAGSASQMTSTIANLGDANLTLTTPITVTPVANCSIAVVSQPASTVAASNSTNLVLSITPTTPGAWSATVSIQSNHADRSPYTWTISGTAIGYHAITYLGNSPDSGSPPSDAGSPYLEGATVTVLGNTGALAKNGFSFAGWNTAANGTGTTYMPGTTFEMPGYDLSLHAIWNTLPTVDAGPPQTVKLTPGLNEPGLYYGAVSSTTINVTTPNPKTLLIPNVAAYTEDPIAGNTTEIYTGQIYDADGNISFTENIDDATRIWIDGNLVLSSDSWSNRVSTANLNLSPGWHNIEIRIFNASGGSGPVSSPGIGYDPAGGTAWQTLVDPGDGSFLRVYEPDTVTVNLDGTVTDPEEVPATTWSVVSKNPSTAANPNFANASAIDTTATFTAEGTYTLRLSANDGFSTRYDEVVITVEPAFSYALTVTGGSGDGNYSPGSQVAITADAPAAGYSFVNWTSSGGGSFANASSSTTIFTMPANAVTVTANYALNTAPVVSAGADQTVALQSATGPVQMILAATDPIQGFRTAVVGGNTTNGISGTDWPTAENPPKAIDGSTGTKYLNYGKVGSGFHITPAAGATTLTGVRIYTANDQSGRDPLTISIEGSNGGDLNQGSSWTLIQDNIDLGINTDPGRLTAGPLVPLSASASYTSYRIIVKSMRNTGQNSVQYSELQLHGFTGAFTTVNLAGSVTDAEQTPTATWSVVSKNPPSAADPIFGNASQPVTTASFKDLGTYVLRLTGADGYVQTTDDITITVADSTPTYALTVTSGSGDGTYASGAQVTITADAPASGYRFVNWTSSGGGSFANASSSTTTFTMPANAATVTANYGLNTAPVVNAGADQTVYLSGSSWMPGITYQPITGDGDSGISSTKTYTHAVDFGSDTPRALINGVQFQAGGTTFGSKTGTSATVGTGTTTIPTAHGGNTAATPYLNGASACAMEALVEDMNYNNATGEITLTGLTPGVHYQFRLYHRQWAVGDRSQNIGFDTDGVGTTISQAEYPGTFHQDDATQPDPGFATATQVNALCFDYSLPAGVTSLKVYINQTGTGTYHLYGLTNEVSTSLGALVNLNGTATDADGDSLSTTWSVVSKDPSTAANPTFANASQASTTATFTEAGTYVLRLSANDGLATSTDDITITVGPPLPAQYATWAAGTFSILFTDIALTSNPDGDSMSNLMEFAFGTDPTLSREGPLAIDGSSHGSPTLIKNGGTMEFYFVRRKDHGTSGSVSYTVQFSNNLTSFTNNDNGANPLIKVGDSALNAANYEVMKVLFPSGTRFGRVQVSVVP